MIQSRVAFQWRVSSPDQLADPAFCRFSIGAVIGRDFSYTLIRAVASRDENALTDAQLYAIAAVPGTDMMPKELSSPCKFSRG